MSHTKTPQDNKMLQDIRKNKIPDFIEKYQKLIDDTFDAVSKPIPDFQDIIDEKGDIIRTSEQRMFGFIQTRKAAIDSANDISIQINELERELYDPTFFEAKNEDDEIGKPVSKATSPAKRFAEK